jgi:DNA-binding winged helix-turn-helix (wHTH) protein
MPMTFGPFALDLAQRRLSRDGREIPLTPKAFDLLRLLVERRPTVIGKQELLEEIWKDTFVTENNLATTISDLRAALGDSARESRYIRTSFTYGYAFIAVVSDAAAIAHESAPSAWRIIHGQREIVLVEGDNILGRSGPGVVALDAVTVSRHHARLSVERTQLFCQDLGSKNGTWVNQRAATERVEVNDGDEVRLGSIVVVARRLSPTQTTQTVERLDAPHGT